MSLPLNCTLLCASGAAYDINPATGQYTADPVFSKAVAYSATPTPISADTINACLVGQNANGIIIAFRGTLPPTEPDSLMDWLQDLFVEPVAFKGLPGEVHEGFLDAVNAILPQVVHGKRGELRQRYPEGQEDQLGGLGLVLNVIVLFNTIYMDAALTQLRGEGYSVRDEDVARLSPLIHQHINMLGRYSFVVPEPVVRGELRPLRTPADDEP